MPSCSRPDKRACSNIAVDALHAALEDALGAELALTADDWRRPRPARRRRWTRGGSSSA